MRNVAAVLAMIVVTSATAIAGDAASRRGAFAFHYEPRLSQEALDWYSRFDVLVTLDPLPPAQVETLHAAGTRLLLYEWSVAFYESRATDWQRSLIRGRREAVLNAAALTGYAGSDSAPAWYFDPESVQFAKNRAADLVQLMAKHRYDGVFFDTTTVESVHPDARREYETRHPDVPYDVAFSRVLIELRRQSPSVTIVTNQGYRDAENYLPYVDADLTESLFTAPRDGSYQLRPWNDPADPWNSIFFLMRNVIEPLAARYPNVKFSHLNYIEKASPETIRLAVAVARIFDNDTFTAAPSTADEFDPIYFADFGKPVAPRVDLPDGSGTYRAFERGVIVITGSGEGPARALFFPSAERPE